ncbi:dienelactone hydrolase family protein [Mycobacterium sp. 48b]|uniref:dienelactone hydrolase family protein n=1 Tax=Mycobacterium sp. 48b TaxID=3400426 RepID=UPI003AACFFC1
MAAITFDTPAGPIGAELTAPAGSGPWPAVVVIHDLRGITDDVTESTARFAAHGYLALAPDLYSRGGAARCITRVMWSMLSRAGRAVDDLHAARDYLKGRSDCTGSVGIAGFCMGGGFALVMGSKGFDAAAPFYPTIPPVYASLAENSCPVVASYGSRDVWNPGNGPRLQRALDQRGIPNDVKVYQGVGHSFANNLPHQTLQRIIGFGRDDEATEDAYRRVFGFFSAHLDH